MNAHNWMYQDIIASAAAPATRESWRRAQKYARYLWHKACTPRQAILRECGLHPPHGPHGMRELHGMLLVPMRDGFGELWSVQQFSPECRIGIPLDESLPRDRPSFLLHARLHGLHHWIGPKVDGDGSRIVIGITEHVTDAVRWHEECGVPVLVAFAPDNFDTLASMVRMAYPSARIGLWARWPEQEATMRGAAAAAGVHMVLDCEAFAQQRDATQ